jgi:primary-amine oxidase
VVIVLLLPAVLRTPPSPARPALPAAIPAHPLDPLTTHEIQTAFTVLRSAGKIGKEDLFPLVALNEPPKEEVLAHAPGKKFRREVLVVVLDRKANKTSEAVIDVKARKLLSWKHIRGAQAPVMETEFTVGAEIVRKDEDWRAAMRKRGIRDFDKVQIDTWAPGIMPGDPKGVRLLRAVSYYRGDAAIGDARPIEGVVALVDMNRAKVIDVLDRGVINVPSDTGDFFDAKVVGKRRPPVQPLSMKQPAGPSFTVRGHEVRWENWHFRFAVHPREGLVWSCRAFCWARRPVPSAVRCASRSPTRRARSRRPAQTATAPWTRRNCLPRTISTSWVSVWTWTWTARATRSAS